MSALPRRGVPVALTVIAAMVTMVMATDSASVAGADDALVLRDQGFFVTNMIELEYVLTGDTVTPNSVTTTSVTTTTTAASVDPEQQPASDADEEPSTTTSTLPVPAALPADTPMVRVALHRPVANRSDVATALSGTPGAIVDVWTTSLSEVIVPDAADGRLTLDLNLPIAARTRPAPADPSTLEITETGLTPVSVSVMSGGAVLAEHVTMVDIGLGSLAPTPMEFAVVAAIGGADVVGGDAGSSPVVDDTTRLLRVRAEVGALYSLLSTSSLPVMVAWDPDLISDLDDGGLTIGLDGSLLEAMANGAELAALPARRIDPSAAVEAGLGDLFAEEMVSGIDELAAAFPGSPVSRSVWFAHPAVTETALTNDGAAWLRSLGTQAVVVNWEAFSRYDGPAFGSIDTTLATSLDIGDGITVPMLVIDPLSSVFDVAAATGNESPMGRAVRFLAEMTALRRVDPTLDRRVLISGTALSPPDPGAVAALERLLMDDPAGVSGDPLSQLASTGGRNLGDTAQWTTGPDVDLATRRLVIQALLTDIDDVASMLPANDPRPVEWRGTLIDLYESRVTLERFEMDVASVTDAIASVRSAVVLPSSGTFNLTGRDSPLPLQIENTGDTTLSVMVRIESAKLEVPPEPVAVVLETGQTVVRVDVAARANGTFPVLVEVLSPLGVPVIEATTLTARANSVTGLGRLVALGLVLVLLSWWYSHLSKRHRERRLAQLTGSVDAHPAASRSLDT